MITLIANHLWQSTLFAAACGGATLALRKNRAQIRHGLWIAASVKFLIPFAAIVAIGQELGWRLLPAVSERQLTIVLEFVGQPFTRTVLPASARTSAAFTAGAAPAFEGMAPVVLFALWMAGCAVILVGWLVRWRDVSRTARGAMALAEGRELAILRRLEQDRAVRRPLTILVSDALMEPGVFGIVNPRLLWPRGISERLDDRQIEAIIAHELSHVSRRDNFVASVHMVVQAAFWFHPLVWWVGARLVDERERACDEDVLRFGSEPEVYAESILKTCQFSVESPLPCVAGVTGANLKQRIEAIMASRGTDALSGAKRFALAFAAVTAIAAPLAVGALNAPRLRAQAATIADNANPTFEVASVKPNKSGDGPNRIGLQPGGRVTVTNMSLRSLIRFAYQFQDFQILGGPDWVGTDRFDITAKAEHDIPPSPPGTIGGGQLMMRSLLSERFKLALHAEKRELPIYELVLARNDGRLGPQLKLPAVDCQAMMNAARERGAPPPAPPAGQRPLCGLRIAPGQMMAGGFPLSQLASALSQLTQRVVVDRTGLAGNFDFELTFTPDQTMMRGGPPPGVTLPAIDPDGPSIFTALQEQLGLKLEPSQGPVDVLIIDRVEAPTPD
jgi:uncharacterized protein (TIGR03435 family)